jgi:hypothetical protein
MARRIRLEPKKPASSGNVGYRRPPKSTQFRAGRSGNPAGRPKGVRNFKTELQATLQTPVKVNRNGRVRTVSTQHASLMVLREKALSGDLRAIGHYISLAREFDEEIADTATRGLDADDQAILDAYFKQRSDEANKAQSSGHDQPSSPNETTDKEPSE